APRRRSTPTGGYSGRPRDAPSARDLPLRTGAPRGGETFAPGGVGGWGGAENYSRRLVCEFGERLDVDVVTLLTANRTDWLDALIDGERERPEQYPIDGRQVTALARWPAGLRRRLRALTPAYHLPNSFAPSAMGRMLAPHMESVA